MHSFNWLHTRVSLVDSLPKGIGDSFKEASFDVISSSPSWTPCRKALVTLSLDKTSSVILFTGPSWTPCRKALVTNTVVLSMLDKAVCVPRGLPAERHW